MDCVSVSVWGVWHTLVIPLKIYGSMSEFVVVDHGHYIHLHNELAKGAMENNAWTFTDQRKIKESAEYYVKCIQQAGTA